MSTANSSESPRRVRVLLVEDSPTERYLLKCLIGAAADLEVVGTAGDGREALALLSRLKPDVVCTDYHMPVMDGLEFILEAMRIHPCAILVLSVAVQSFQRDNIFKLLAVGALDVIAKPIGERCGIGAEQANVLIERIRAIARAPMMRQRLAAASVAPVAAPRPARVPQLVVIGASTGGPQVLYDLLAGLPKGFPVPLVCVQHISPGFIDGMLKWLECRSVLRPELASSGELPQPGRVYFAPDGSHLVLDERGRFRLQRCTRNDIHCPGVDQLMLSVADHHGDAAVGVLLSGMGRDGALGLQAMRQRGARTIVQDAVSSVVFGMPAAAIELAAAEYVLPGNQIGGC